MTDARYRSFINTFRFTRVDIGFNMPGLMSIFVCCNPDRKWVQRSSCEPHTEEGNIIETTYIGNRYKSSHCIIYEKLLKEFKSELGDGVDFDEVKGLSKALAVTTRVERRYYPYRSTKKGFLLRDLPNVKPKLNKLRFIDPKIFPYAEEHILQKLLRRKSISAVRAASKRIRKTLRGTDVRISLLKLDDEWLQSASSAMLAHYRDLIFKADKPKSANVSAYCALQRDLQTN